MARDKFDLRSAGWVRVAVALILLAGVVAVIVWNWQPPAQTAPPAAAAKPTEQNRTRKPALKADPRDTARDRPDRERTDRQ